jgi:hypothetical protein
VGRGGRGGASRGPGRVARTQQGGSVNKLIMLVGAALLALGTIAATPVDASPAAPTEVAKVARPATHSIPAIYVCQYVNPLAHYLNAYLTQHYGTANIYRCEYRGVYSPSTICILVIQGDPNAYWYPPESYDPTPCW